MTIETRPDELRLPREMESNADEALIRRDGERSSIAPVQRPPDLASQLAGWKPTDESLPDVDVGLQPLDDIQFPADVEEDSTIAHQTSVPGLT